MRWQTGISFDVVTWSFFPFVVVFPNAAPPTTAPTGPKINPPAIAPPKEACFLDFWLLVPVVLVTVLKPSLLTISALLISVKGYFVSLIETIPSVRL